MLHFYDVLKPQFNIAQLRKIIAVTQTRPNHSLLSGRKITNVLVFPNWQNQNKNVISLRPANLRLQTLADNGSYNYCNKKGCHTARNVKSQSAIMWLGAEQRQQQIGGAVAEWSKALHFKEKINKNQQDPRFTTRPGQSLKKLEPNMIK